MSIEITDDTHLNTWLKREIVRFPYHIRNAAERQTTFLPNSVAMAAGRALRKVQEQGKGDIQSDSHWRVKWEPTLGGGAKLYNYGEPVLTWLPNIQNIRAPRFAIQIYKPTSTTKRFVNGVCNYFGVRFYCWTHEGQLWAMWTPDDGDYGTVVAPVDRLDVIRCVPGA